MMLCKRPFIKGLLSFGCGQCMPCRINRNRQWAHRILLESYKHEKNSFVTLTYDDEHLPEGGFLVKKHYRQFLDTLRKKVRPTKVRFYCAGEYGESSWRPHFHLALFGLGPEDQERIAQAWGKGFVHVGTLTFDSAQYITKYLQKGYTRPDDHRLCGRPPEFSRMSLKPGLGGTAIGDIADALSKGTGVEAILAKNDVPTSLKHGRRSMPLGRYLRKKLREHLGYDEEKIKEENLQRWHETVCEMLEEANSLPTARERAQASRDVFVNEQKICNIETKAKIFKKGGFL